MRADNSLEFLILLDIPQYPFTGSCSKGFQEIAFELQSAIENAIGDSVNLSNQERYLNDVLAYATQELPTSLTGHVFDPRDGPVCRANFALNEALYLDNKE